jgi:hypothetical protein
MPILNVLLIVLAVGGVATATAATIGYFVMLKISRVDF